MIISREEMYQLRKSFVHQMHDYIKNAGDESIYGVWITYGVPDNPSEEDFEFYADSAEDFKMLCSLFGKLVVREEELNG